MAGNANTVIVGCKLPHGLVAQLGDKSVTFRGINSTLLRDANGMPLQGIRHGAYGTTEVDAQFWAAWLEKNKGLSYVKKNMVFAEKTIESTNDKAKDLKEVKSGLEPIIPSVDDKVGKLTE